MISYKIRINPFTFNVYKKLTNQLPAYQASHFVHHSLKLFSRLHPIYFTVALQVAKFFIVHDFLRKSHKIEGFAPPISPPSSIKTPPDSFKASFCFRLQSSTFSLLLSLASLSINMSGKGKRLLYFDLISFLF